MRPSAREVCDILQAMPFGDGPTEMYEHPEDAIEGQQPAIIEEDDGEGELEEVGVLGNGGGHFEDEILETVPMSMSDGGQYSSGGALLETMEVIGEASLISTGLHDSNMQTAEGASVAGSLSTRSNQAAHLSTATHAAQEPAALTSLSQSSPFAAHVQDSSHNSAAYSHV